MPDIFYLISKWWKQMLVVVILSLAVAATVLYLKPSKYLSIATALPASSYSGDKASVFNKNIQQLYPAIGTPDDLDKIVGTAQLDTVYIAVAEQFDLASHYKVQEQGDAAKRKAAYLLKTNTRVIKSDYSELKVKVWDGERTLAPELANAIMDKLQSIHQDLQISSNVSLIKSLQNGREKLQAKIDSTSFTNPDIRKAQTDQLQEYEKLIGEYQLLVDNKPPVLITVERARIPDWPDKPKRFQILAATFVLSLLFVFFVILIIERRKPSQQ